VITEIGTGVGVGVHATIVPSPRAMYATTMAARGIRCETSAAENIGRILA